MSDPYIPLVPTTKVAGRVAAIPKGEWNSTTTYKKLDIVTYDYCAYMAKKTSTNQMPTGQDDEYWMLLVESFIRDFVGATETTDGHKGMVPEPKAGEQHKVLRGDGSWGPKLEVDVVKQGNLYGYINSTGDFVAFQSQEDIVRIITELLIPEDAQESLDTLKEIADWIQDHPGDAAEMNERITELENTSYKKTGGQITGDVHITGNLTLDNPLPISSGGTNASTAENARINLNAFNNDNVAPAEDDEIANRNYADGEHFILNDKLYIAISPIAIGDTIRVANSAINANVLIIDIVNASNESPVTSSDDSSDDESTEPSTDGIKVTTTNTSVTFRGTGNNVESVFPICYNLLDNSSVEINKPYQFSSDSSYISDGISIIPKFMLYDDEDLVDMVDTFNLEDYPNVNIVKPVYIYQIDGNIDLTLYPKVHLLSTYYNCILSDTIEKQIEELDLIAVPMIGATDNDDGISGLVPTPLAGDNHKFLKGDGSYSKVSASDEITGVLPIQNGGTGANNSTEALVNLGGVSTSTIANTETGSKASKAYAVLDQIMWNGALYTVTQPISANDIFEVGTNLTLSDNLVKQIKSISAVSTAFIGATAESDGSMGLVPAPLAGSENDVLKGDGSWGSISTNFVGTMDEWEALSLEEKIKYSTADIIPEYTLTINPDTNVDSYSLDPTSANNKYGYGRIVNINAVAKTGYNILSGAGPHVVTQDETINITSGIKRLSVSIVPDEHVTEYSITPESSDGIYDYGTVVTVTANANDHYHITAGTGNYTITDDTIINITSAIDTFTVTINADTGIESVRLSPSSTNNVYDYGTVVTAIVTTKPGYDLISGSGQYTITDNTTITVVSQIQTYAMTLVYPMYYDESFSDDTTGYYHKAISTSLSPAPISGSDTPDGYYATYNYGTVVTVSATPLVEHEVVTAGEGEYTITEDITINLETGPEQITLTVHPGANINSYTLSPEPVNGTYDYGTVVRISAVPQTGYDLNAISAVTATTYDVLDISLGYAEYTATVNADINIVAAIKTFTVTVNPDANVTSYVLSPEPVNGKYDYGTVVTVTAVAAEHYDIASGTGEYTITDNTTINIISALEQFCLDIRTDEHIDEVSLSPEPLRTSSTPYGTGYYYEYGTVVTVSATAVEHYTVITGIGEYRITEDTTVSLTTELQRFTLTVNWDSNVNESSISVLPAPLSSGSSNSAKYYVYYYGTTATLSATPDTGYDIVSGLGEYLMNEDITADIVSEIQKFTLTVNADSNVDSYILSPEPANGKYDYGTVVTVTATPKVGYAITSGPDDYTITSDTTVTIESELLPLEFASDNTFTLSVTEPGWNGTMEYSIDDGETWTVWDGSAISGSSSNSIFVKGTGNTRIYNGSYANRFIFTGKRCIGNIETLLDYDTALAGNHPTMAVGCFHSAFEGCTTLVTGPILPATSLTDDCYYAMFSGCSSLSVAPELPATTLGDYCYAYMFSNCTSLTAAPRLPATTITEGCYDSMFSGCTALSVLPYLPASTLTDDCYEEMFLNCSSVKLSKTETEEYKYEYRIPSSSAGIDASSLRRMFYNTGGTFTGTPAINVTYYTTNQPV